MRSDCKSDRTLRLQIRPNCRTDRTGWMDRTGRMGRMSRMVETDKPLLGGEGACLSYNIKICGHCPRWLCGPLGPLGPPGAPGKNGGLAAFFTAWRWNRPSARMTS